MNAIISFSVFPAIFLSCLCGSEHGVDLESAFLQFLSCLCGSELVVPSVRCTRAFLSCLCGSERHISRSRTASFFLSCLCGSEQGLPRNNQYSLNILYGSSCKRAFLTNIPNLLKRIFLFNRREKGSKPGNGGCRAQPVGGEAPGAFLPL